MRLTRPTDVGAIVKDYRRSNKIRQADLAERLQVSPKWLSQFENGKATAQLGLVIRVLTELGFSLSVEATTEKRKKPRFSIDDIVDG